MKKPRIEKRRSIKNFLSYIEKKQNSISKSIRGIKLSEYLAFISLLVSICAIYYTSIESKKTAEFNRESIEQTQLNNKLTVQPLLSFSSNIYLNDPIFDFIGIEVDNRGVGPALVAPPLLIYDGIPLGLMDPSNSENIIKKLNVPTNVFFFKTTGYTLMPGEKRKLFWSEKKDSLTTQKYMLELMKHINIVLLYTSVYQEETWFNAFKSENEEFFNQEWFPKLPMLIERKKK
ncbi:MAG: hypothetical protein V4580_17855 [Bacteroidota bacterium]